MRRVFTSIVPEYDSLVYGSLRNFRNSSIPAETSLEQAKADILTEKANKKEESFRPKFKSRTVSVAPVLDRAVYNKLPNFRSSTRPQEQGLQQALVDIGTQKSRDIVLANRYLHAGDSDAAEWILRRSLTQLERETATVDFLYEQKLSEAKAKMKERSEDSESVFDTFGKVPRHKYHESDDDDASEASDSALQSDPGSPRTVIHDGVTVRGSQADTLLAPTVQNLAASAGPYATMSQGLTAESLEAIERIRSGPGKALTKRAEVSKILQKEHKDPLRSGRLESGYDLEDITRLRSLGYTGNGVSAIALNKHPLRRVNVSFGRYNIDKAKLAKNIVSFTHKNSNHTVTGLPAMSVSDALKNVILQTINEMPPSLDQLSAEEVGEFNHILKAACVAVNCKRPAEPAETRPAASLVKKLGLFQSDADLTNRLQIIIGEISAGNNSKALKVELSRLLNALHRAKMITAAQVKAATEKYITATF
jgi:hypothetical protein